MPSALADIVRRVHDDYCSTLFSGFNNDIFIIFKFSKGLLLLDAEIGGLFGSAVIIAVDTTLMKLSKAESLPSLGVKLLALRRNGGGGS